MKQRDRLVFRPIFPYLLIVVLAVALCAAVLLTATPANAAGRPPGPTQACGYRATFGDIPCSEIDRAVHEASVEFRIDEARFRRVVRCESKFDPFVRSKGGHQGLTQQGAPFVRAQYPRFNAAVGSDVLGNVYSPFDNARVAAWVISREGYRQWSCKG